MPKEPVVRMPCCPVGTVSGYSPTGRRCRRSCRSAPLAPRLPAPWYGDYIQSTHNSARQADDLASGRRCGLDAQPELSRRAWQKGDSRVLARTRCSIASCRLNASVSSDKRSMIDHGLHLSILNPDSFSDHEEAFMVRFTK